MKKLTADDVLIISLKDVKKNKSDWYDKSLDALVAMKRADSEGSPEEIEKSCAAYRQWIDENVSRKNSRYDTYVLVDRKSQEIVGTGSVLPDDQDTGKRYGIPGVWTGGWRIHKNYRGNGLGNLLIDHLDSHIEKIAEEERKPTQANFFTENPISDHLGKERGYNFTGSFYIPYFNDTGRVYSKTFMPNF